MLGAGLEEDCVCMNQESQLFVMDAVFAKLRDPEFDTYADSFRGGMIGADWPQIYVGKLELAFTVLFHFYHPDRKTLLPNAKSLGLRRWNKALQQYPKDKAAAYFSLGRVFHLLTGVAIPAHARFSYHLFHTDDLENYMDLFVKKNPKVRITHIDGPVSELFDSIARKAERFEVKPNNFWISLKYVLTGKKDLLSKEELERQAPRVLDLAVSYGYALCTRFQALKL